MVYPLSPCHPPSLGVPCILDGTVTAHASPIIQNNAQYLQQQGHEGQGNRILFFGGLGAAVAPH